MNYYWQMAEHFRWLGRSSKWVQRRRKLLVIGRIHKVSYIVQRNYTTCDYCCTINRHNKFRRPWIMSDTQYETYNQPFLAWFSLRPSTMDRRITTMCTNWNATGNWKSLLQILIYGSLENLKQLWEMFIENLPEDFIHTVYRKCI